MTVSNLPKEFSVLFPEEDEQVRILSLLHRRLEALSTALTLRNAPTIIHSSNQLKAELLMLGFRDLEQVVSHINDYPLDKSLADEFKQKWEAWKASFMLRRAAI